MNYLLLFTCYVFIVYGTSRFINQKDTDEKKNIVNLSIRSNCTNFFPYLQVRLNVFENPSIYVCYKLSIK